MELPSIHIKNFGFHRQGKLGQTRLIEIAKISSTDRGLAKIYYIDKYFLTKVQKKASKVLSILPYWPAQSHDAGQIASHMDTYGIDSSSEKGQEALIKIASILAKHHGAEVSEHIQKFR